jgi:hypothetical protein
MIGRDDSDARMTADPVVATGAPAAFLRGIERRAVLFAGLQCGDPVAGDAAVAAASLAFGRGAAAVPMAEWPIRFWSLLLAAPAMRRTEPSGTWPEPWAPLAVLGNGPRAALLLRLVAVLDMDPAAEALGVSPETYRAALQRAIPYRDDGSADRDAWQAWVAAVRADLAALSDARLDALRRGPVRTDAAGTLPPVALTPPASPSLAPAPTPPDVALRGDEAQTATPRRAGRRWLAVAATLAVLAGALAAAWFLRPQWFDRLRTAERNVVRIRDLPPADAPAARFDADFASWTERDFVLLADIDGLQRADDLPFLAWHAAQRAVQAAPDAALPANAATSTLVVPAAALAMPATLPHVDRPDPLQAPAGAALPASLAGVIATAPASIQPELRAQALAWSTWSPSQREAFRQRAAQWHAQAPDVRARQRERHAAWRRLDAVALDAIEAAARDYALRTPQEQAALRAQFDAQDAVAQRGWLLGPAIGVEYPKLQPLLAHLPESQHAPMLRMLRRMSAAERTDLAMLAQRVPPQDRDALVRALLSTSDANRVAWLRTRLEQ